jgi:hypothetical protein
MAQSPSSAPLICGCCRRPETAETLSCVQVDVSYSDGLMLPPIAFDPAAGLFGAVAMGTLTVAEAREIYVRRGKSGCPQCFVRPFAFHHPSCAAEPCPRCGLTLMRACRCKRPMCDEET